MTHATRVKPGVRRKGIAHWLSAAAAVALLTIGGHAQAAAPKAGNIIGNQASASYTDAGGQTRTATSNVVETVVAQVYDIALTADGAKNASPGSQVTYPHTLTNNGNGSDSFTLSVSSGGGDFAHTSLRIYEDLNGDGNPDNFTDLNGTNVTVGYASSYKFVVVGSVPNTATGGDSGTLTVTATSVGDGTKTASNTDTTSVVTGAVVNVVKSMSASHGESPSGTYKVTLAYTNSGNSSATDFEVKDALPTGMTYVAGTGRWSASTSALTDAADGDELTADSVSIDYTESADVITAIIDSVPAGVSGTITFDVNIDSGLAPQTLENKGQFRYDGTITYTDTNVVTFVVDPTPSVSLDDTGADDSGDGADTDSDTTVNDVARVATAQAGASVLFKTVVTNDGSGTDTYNMTVAAGDFPSGTTFVLYKSDAVSPLTDTNADGKPDTGPMGAGDTYAVYVKAILPPDAASVTGYSATLTATSTVKPSISDTTSLTIDEVTSSTVDLTNNVSVSGGAQASDGLGVQATGEATAVTTESVTPTEATNTATFQLFVNNTSALGDSYELKASTDNTFASIALPSGWSVKFYVDSDGNTATTDDITQATSTGAIAAGGNKLVWAVVSIPQNFAANTYDIYFRAQSPSTGAGDVKHDAVTVGTINDLNVTPNNAGQVYPGGSVVYSHKVENAGNTTLTTIALTTADNKSGSGWNSVIYEDTDADGELSAGDNVISSIASLAAGANKTIFVKVFAPSGALEGVVNTTTLTADATVASDSASDATTVIIGDLALTKKHALDLNCDGDTADAGEIGFRTSRIESADGALPGSCLLYRVVASNSGIADITSVVIDDSVPAFTTYQEDAGNGGVCADGLTLSVVADSTSTPANGGTGKVSASYATLAAGASVQMDFCVKIDE